MLKNNKITYINYNSKIDELDLKNDNYYNEGDLSYSGAKKSL